jgi:Zn-finger nucleic acid-binding protein
METKQVKGVNLDECVKCKGIWFDPGELDEIKEEIEPDLRWMDFDLWKKLGEFRVTSKPLNCPHGHGIGLRSLYFKNMDVNLQFCPVCKGVWLQTDDLQKIIVALLREAEALELSEYIKASLKEAAEVVAHPDNLISEWRDLQAVLRLLKYRFFTENPRIKDAIVGIQKSLPL